jgi:hypothetical protein
MRYLMMCATVATLLGLNGRPIAAQSEAKSETTRHAWIFRAPSFVFQPGALSSNFVDAPEGTSASTKLNFRVVTAIPTTIPRTTAVAIVQWTPWNSAAGVNQNAPSFVYGPAFTVFDLSPVSLDFDVLGSYGPAAKATDESAYTHKLVLEADLSLKVGDWLTRDRANRWHRVALYVYPAYVATGVPSGASRWVALYGVSLPVAP